MQYLDLSFDDPIQNILCDEVLLTLANKHDGDEVVRFWESPIYFVVLGRTGKEQEDLKFNAIKQDNIAVLRRCSGGGTVVQGKGCFNFSFVLSKKKRPKLEGITDSYRYLSALLVDAFKQCGIEVIFQPISDLADAITNKKFSGNAQKRGRDFILHHGTVLYDFDLNLISKYLNMPQDMPKYRNGRSHLDFVTNINVSVSAIKQAFQDVLGQGDVRNTLNNDEQQLLDQFNAQKNIVLDI